MGKLAILTDLHVDINQLGETDLAQLRELLLQQRVTHIHLAGDTANKVARMLAVIDYLERDFTVTFHWGNHEMADIEDELDFEEFDDARFLNVGSYSLSSTYELVGVNGWYDYQFSDRKDTKEILRLKNLFWYDRVIKRQGTDPEISQRICERLRLLLEMIPKQKKIILSTHFVPRQEFIVQHTGKYQHWNELNAFLGSKQIGDLLTEFPAIEQVVFGHTHRRFGTKKIGTISYHCRPLGYYYEWQITRDFVRAQQLSPDIQPTKLRPFVRKYQEVFMQYRQIHLREEFQKSLTLINY